MKLADITHPSTAYTPIDVCVAVLERMTQAQIERVTELVDRYTDCGHVRLRTDSWMKDAILFDLFKRPNPAPGGADHILSGLIEADGRSHT